MCAAIVQLDRTYYLYYLVLRFNSDLCAAYLDYYATLTQILRALVALTQLVASTTSRLRPVLPVACHTSRDNGGVPHMDLTNSGPSIPPPSHPVHPYHPASSNPMYPIIPSSALKRQFLLENRIKLIRSSIFYEGYPPTSLP